jgi:protein gp37
MATNTHIEWTQMTWNPVRGCTRVSEGCRNCYAERMATRFSGPGKPYHGLAMTTSSGPRWTNQIKPIPEVLDQPLHWREPRLIFVNSMSDLFHQDVPLDFIQRVFSVMESCPRHTFQILTKRSERLRDLAPLLPWPSNVWMGVSVEDSRVVSRVSDLQSVPAAVRFLSVEPLIGPISNLSLNGIHWVIVGGESGPGARTMQTDWVEQILSQCRENGVAFFFKQWGGVRKGRTGRLLNGRTYDEMPLSTTSSRPTTSQMASDDANIPAISKAKSSAGSPTAPARPPAQPRPVV